MSQGVRPNSFSFHCSPLDLQLDPSRDLGVCQIEKSIGNQGNCIEIILNFRGYVEVHIMKIYVSKGSIELRSISLN
jgi:hypothetical protein